MKGALHTDELMSAIVREGTGLRTERRISHVFVLDVPTYCKPLLITDAAINISPCLDDKRDIIRNAIDLAHAIGIARPKVAILSAVETVEAKIPSTIEAAALCKAARFRLCSPTSSNAPAEEGDRWLAGFRGVTSPSWARAGLGQRDYPASTQCPPSCSHVNTSTRRAWLKRIRELSDAFRRGLGSDGRRLMTTKSLRTLVRSIAAQSGNRRGGARAPSASLNLCYADWFVDFSTISRAIASRASALSGLTKTFSAPACMASAWMALSVEVVNTKTRRSFRSRD